MNTQSNIAAGLCWVDKLYQIREKEYRFLHRPRWKPLTLNRHVGMRIVVAV